MNTEHPELLCLTTDYCFSWPLPIVANTDKDSTKTPDSVVFLCAPYSLLLLFTFTDTKIPTTTVFVDITYSARTLDA